MKPLVSVIIPLFNGQDFLAECINSVVNQTYSNLEIIIVDNGSSDDFLKILHQFNDHRIILLKTPNNGACAARNFGYKNSTGDYIQFLDCDDYISLNKIEEQIRILKHSDQNLAVCNTAILSEQDNFKTIKTLNEPWLYNYNDPIDFILNLYKNYGMLQINVSLIPRNIILKAGLWNENLKQDQDGEFFCRIILASENIRYANNVTNYYRKYYKRISISNNKNYEYSLSTLNSLILKSGYITEKINNKEVNNILAKHFKILAIRFYTDHEKLYKVAMEKCKLFGNTNYLPTMGGKISETLKYLLGWKMVKKLSILKAKVISKISYY
jgi:glycosyltransferase involved in cell wall biosynthesis